MLDVLYSLSFADTFKLCINTRFIYKISTVHNILDPVTFHKFLILVSVTKRERQDVKKRVRDQLNFPDFCGAGQYKK